MRDYIIGTGFFERNGHENAEWFYRLWWKNKKRYSSPKRIFVMAHGGGSVSARTMRECPADWIHLDGDLGHIHQINNGTKPFDWSGFTIALATLCLLAYQDECDLFFAEQDMLAFGPWPATIYGDIKDAKVAYGKGQMMPCFQSLMLIKHEYLPTFVATYVPRGSEKNKGDEGERRMAKLIEQFPSDYQAFSFPFDRDRPLDLSLPVFYGQQFTMEELTALKNAGLLEM